jgi:hypothetical protein
MNPGTLVRHSTWGLGKVMETPLPYLVIHFSSLAADPNGPRRKLQLHAPQLTVADVQSDPELDNVSLVTAKARSSKPRVAKPKAPPKPLQHSLDQAIEWFKTTFPGGFRDPGFVKDELTAKRGGHQDWLLHFGNGKAEALLESGDSTAIADGLKAMFQATKIPAPFEMMAARDGLKDGEAATRLLRAVMGFVAQPDAATFKALTEAVGSLPSPAEGAKVLTWPNVTLLPFLVDPKRFMVLKPTVSKRIGRRMGFELAYSSAPTWPVFESSQKMSTLLIEKLAPLGAEDFIDVQSFVWVTRDLE